MYIDLGTKIRDGILTRYPALDKSDIPDSRNVTQIDHKGDDIEHFEVIFWHRLLKRIYQDPLEIECVLHRRSDKDKVNTGIETAIFRKTQQRNRWELRGRDEAFASKIERGQIKPLPVNWKYLIRLPSGGIVELGTKDRNTVFYIAHVIRSESTQQKDGDETRAFINRLLAEANRLRHELFSPKREFEKRQGLKLYFLFNVYRANYLSALTMLRLAKSKEAKLRQAGLRYDARTTDLKDDKKREYIEKALLKSGMFYCSTITYLFMALEGFVNLIFHVFLKDQFRHEAISIEERTDLRQKLTLMPALCKGFKENTAVSATILSDFKKLQDYRNSLFHSKVKDSLKNLCYVEDGFIYTYEIKDTFVPSLKLKLSIDDVKNFQSSVDKTIADVLRSMDRETRMQTKNHIMKDAYLRISVSETGNLTLG